MDQRGARACSLEQRNRVGPGIPGPPEVELEEKRRAVQLQQVIEKRAPVVQWRELAGMVVESEP